MMEPQAVYRQRDLLALTDDRLQRLKTINRREVTNLLKLLLKQSVIDLKVEDKEADDE